MSLTPEEGARLHNVVIELGPAIVNMIRTGGGGFEDLGATIAGLLAVIVISIDEQMPNPERCSLIDILAEEAKIRLLSR